MTTRNNIIGKAFLALSFTAVISSCTGDFQGYNTNQHEATDGMMSKDDLYVGSRFAQILRNVVMFKDGENLDSDYQIAQGLSSDAFAGYISPTIATNGGTHNGTYSFIDNWIQKIFNSGYTKIMTAWSEIARFADENDLETRKALATIAKVEGMHRVADTYGPIPYVNFGLGNLGNQYDGLESVYNRFFEELDEAIEVLTPIAQTASTDRIMEDYDIVYQGDITKWVKFANTLRLRLAVRVSNANPTLAQAQAEKAVSNPVGLIETADERASIKHSSISYYHPLYEICYNMNSGDSRPGASIEAYMNGYSDPRRAAYFTTASDGLYHGVRLGVKTSNWAQYRGGNISNVNMNMGSTEIVWMTAAESFFLRAEGAVRQWAMGGTAEEFYNEGIRASFAENNLSAASADAYLADDTSVPAAFTDNVESNSYSAPSTITIKWSDSASEQQKYEKIITQKWIALFPDGPEGWAEFRRTGYPRLFPTVTNESGGTIDNTLQVCRLPYPRTEYDTNRDGVMTGVELLGGLDNGGVQLWWDKR